MLSYKHGYHAGNHADVFKHICLLQAFKILKKHHKSITYIDTHAGSGNYYFESPYMKKNSEFNSGIKKISNYKYENQGILFYLKTIQNINKSKKLLFYPGSPDMINFLSAGTDKIYLYELHKNEYKELTKSFLKSSNVKILNKDGFNFMNQKLKFKDKILTLVDPSYEMKEDYEKVIELIKKINQDFININALIWYPILNMEQNDKFIDNVRKIGSNKLTRLELPIKKFDDRLGMKGSGLIVLNGSNNLIQNLKNSIIELYKILKEEDCNIRPKIQKI
tara:strand:- start:3925 stop:4758 length:834 start_codon:yes stop_codon:yes gene_type:complete